MVRGEDSVGGLIVCSQNKAFVIHGAMCTLIGPRPLVATAAGLPQSGSGRWESVEGGPGPSGSRPLGGR